MAEDDEDRGGSRLEETKRVARIVEIATLLAAQPRRWTRARLAAKYELCERQIARDLAVLLKGRGSIEARRWAASRGRLAKSYHG